MKSGKQRRAEIRAKRLKAARRAQLDTHPASRGGWPKNSVAADHAQLAHDNTYGPFPNYYVDQVFTCIDCDIEQLWTAKQQKWWYEIAKGKIASRAVRCRACRKVRRGERDSVRNVHVEGLIKKYGVEEAAKRLNIPVDELRNRGK
ncbi:MAG: zinc-ribbon domain containing protein [Hyphomicrobiaceae bacterium]